MLINMQHRDDNPLDIGGMLKMKLLFSNDSTNIYDMFLFNINNFIYYLYYQYIQ